MEETIDNVLQSPVSACRLLLGKGSQRALCSNVDPFVARSRHRVVSPAPRGRIPSHLSPRDRMQKLQTRRGRQRYALRKTVEPVFGQIKQGRGFRQFLLRGLEKVNGEWSLI